MPFEKGEKNKGGRPRGTPQPKTNLFGDALRVVLLREAKNDAGDLRKNYMHIAEKLVEDAKRGKIESIREVIDRVDGKVPTKITGADGDGNDVPTGIAVVFISSDKKED